MPRRKPFQYDTLLRVRRRQEDLRAQALAAVRRDLEAAESHRADIANERMCTLRRASETASRGFTASDVRRFFQYERHLALLGTEADARIRELREAVAGRREELEEAMKQRRIVEGLREQRQTAFLRELNKEEQAMADEVASNAAALERIRYRRRKQVRRVHGRNAP